ncbi:hypothetical protein KI387_015991 [Taxus chinensis]|uniref:Uncharacterized protein n=1 Tax=Taxus chinensis TaxID=29808 RepID=A0AA38LHN5_TAXCH|nr:hypothetical protein KI387_015991 [Taxus chinensis]
MIAKLHHNSQKEDSKEPWEPNHSCLGKGHVEVLSDEEPKKELHSTEPLKVKEEVVLVQHEKEEKSKLQEIERKQTMEEHAPSFEFLKGELLVGNLMYGNEDTFSNLDVELSFDNPRLMMNDETSFDSNNRVCDNHKHLILKKLQACIGDLLMKNIGISGKHCIIMIKIIFSDQQRPQRVGQLSVNGARGTTTSISSERSSHQNQQQAEQPPVTPARASTVSRAATNVSSERRSKRQ